ncbi:hypothetical protein PRUPE_6G030500 [Prunus persica]|uniref:HMA domain-containing protein n=1 Tax=Prunus persica TaxID=3760 RepID=A0A251NJJ0_PRUPE|nr:uncharacterized protein LOC18775550 [Prunus persica]ONH99455.1 hypothetical protein PRUPE_6G030500 [Prunus persica]
MCSYIERFIDWICFWEKDISCTLPTTKQKIVFKVQINSEKYKTKALKTAAKARGVSNVSVEVEKELMEVTGVGVDSVCLAKSLQKKLGYATIVSVEEAEKEDNKKEDKKKEEIKAIQWASTYFPRPMFPVYYDSDGNPILN